MENLSEIKLVLQQIKPELYEQFHEGSYRAVLKVY